MLFIEYLDIMYSVDYIILLLMPNSINCLMLHYADDSALICSENILRKSAMFFALTCKVAISD